MQPVKQTRFGHLFGNCFAACVASIFELPLDQVPHFMVNRNNTANECWFEDFGRWLQRTFGSTPVMLTGELGTPSSALCIASGPAKRGFNHAVIWQNGRMVFDPHPDNTGLISVTDYIYFIANDPAALFSRCYVENRRV